MATPRSVNLGEPVVAAIERQEWLEPIGERLQRAIAGAFRAGGRAGQAVKDLLHGTWLGHPLHAVVTDVPVGAWSAALVLDALDASPSGRRRPAYGAGADAAITVGLAGAAVAVVTGLTDWQHTAGAARRTGLVHATLNSVAAALYVTSLASRRRGARPAGRTFAVLGFGAMLAGAYLGGSLVYRHRIGVTHTGGVEDEPAPLEFVSVWPESELGEGERRLVTVDGLDVLLVRRGGGIHALAATCSHLGGPLLDGRLREASIVCPWHGSRFALEDGRVLSGPAVHPQPCFETRVRDGRIEVRASVRRRAAA
jgi:nitrite reductase/ring-hydroxylating ferredoxin subunit/uncharacterized membrane protein